MKRRTVTDINRNIETLLQNFEGKEGLSKMYASGFIKGLLWSLGYSSNEIDDFVARRLAEIKGEIKK